ncbi:MAG: hypothetical protein CSA53_00830 [Gammaproteobacteria bacterium]|nr:MAG: hypothetical protein CSA53_00830 [Gammaproteobacteria bacterium]
MQIFVKRVSQVLAVGSLLFVQTALANPPGMGADQHSGPPTEAVEACKDRLLGDPCEVTTSHGGTMVGRCIQPLNEADGEGLVCAPEPVGESESPEPRN